MHRGAWIAPTSRHAKIIIKTDLGRLSSQKSCNFERKFRKMGMKRWLTAALFLGCLSSMQAQDLRFKNGQFKIVQFTDLHYKQGNPASKEATDNIVEVVTAEKPDLIVLTGDIIYSSPGSACLQEVLKVLTNLKTPFCYLLGNHDPEQGTPVTQLYDLAQQNAYCVQPKRVGNVLDYALPILSTSGWKVTAVLYCMDTHAYNKMAGVGGYQWLTADQIARYRRWSGTFTQRNGGKPVNSLMFMHYPLPEYNDAVANTQVTLIGTRMEKAYAPNLNSGMFSAVKECGDVMGIFCGHDHDNDYSLMYYRVLLAHGRFSGGNTEYNHLRNGARVIVLYEGKRSFDTYIRERGGRILYETTYPDSYTKDDWKKRNGTR